METIYETMKQRLMSLTGLTVADGGDLSLRLYAAAAELYSLWEQTEFVVRQCFPQTASGNYLDDHAQVRGIQRRDGAVSIGTLQFSISAAAGKDLKIPKGLVCADGAGNRFETVEAGIIPVGQLSCQVPARAMEAGTAGNVPADSITYMVQAPVGVETCTNPAAFTDGSDGEEDDSLRKRILESYQKLPNGANVAYYETQALNVDGVTAVQVLPRNRGVGTVDIVIATENGVPSQTLMDTVQAKLRSQREICVDLQVLPPEERSVDVAAVISVNGNYMAAEVIENVKTALSGYFTGKRLGEPVLLAKLGNLIYQVPGVENYQILQPTADVARKNGGLPVLGTLTVTEMEA